MLRIVVMTLVFAVVIACGAGAYALYSGGAGTDGNYTSSDAGYGFGYRNGDDGDDSHNRRRHDDD